MPNLLVQVLVLGDVLVQILQALRALVGEVVQLRLQVVGHHDILCVLLLVRLLRPDQLCQLEQELLVRVAIGCFLNTF